LTPVWVPGVEQEAIRDLVRAREDLQHTTRQLRQRLKSFLLRHGRVYAGRHPEGQAYQRWLELQRFDSPYQQVVFQEYIDAVQQLQTRVAALETEMARARQQWSLGRWSTAW
jgi:transposase